MAFEVKEFTMQDYTEATALWRTCEGVGLSSADSRESIDRYLERNPGMSFVAREGGVLIGAVLTGHDGRRGYLHHLAVRADRRGLGVGRTLAEHSLAALRTAGIDKCHLFVFVSNSDGLEFWCKIGWKERIELIVLSKDV